MDDTGVNGVRFKCKAHDGESEAVIGEEGEFGGWKSWTVINNYSDNSLKFLKKARVQVDNSGDKAGITGMEIWMCPADQGEGDEVAEVMEENADEGGEEEPAAEEEAAAEEGA